MDHFFLPSSNQLIHSLLDLWRYFRMQFDLPNKRNKLLVLALKTDKTNYHMDDLDLGVHMLQVYSVRLIRAFSDPEYEHLSFKWVGTSGSTFAVARTMIFAIVWIFVAPTLCHTSSIVITIRQALKNQCITTMFTVQCIFRCIMTFATGCSCYTRCRFDWRFYCSGIWLDCC